jgi:DNA-directed RNA polymerase subunit K/omega
MIELPEGFDSVFRYIVVVSQRAEQLINGAKPRATSDYIKPTLAAREDVDAGEVPWRVLSQEELDAQRQAIVEQFRAEMGGEDFAGEKRAPVRDVLPTAARKAEPEEREPGERDDELARLQRLLGMVGEESSGDEEGEEEEDMDALAAEAEDLDEIDLDGEDGNDVLDVDDSSSEDEDEDY